MNNTQISKFEARPGMSMWQNCPWHTFTSSTQSLIWIWIFTCLEEYFPLSKASSSSVPIFPIGIFHTFFENKFSSEVSDLLVMEKQHVWNYLFQKYIFSSPFPNPAPEKCETLSKSKTAGIYTKHTSADLPPNHFSSHGLASNWL